MVEATVFGVAKTAKPSSTAVTHNMIDFFITLSPSPPKLPSDQLFVKLAGPAKNASVPLTRSLFLTAKTLRSKGL
jgi:hypothetical protein